MKGMWVVGVLMFGFGIGCVAATVAQSVVVPPVRAGSDPTRWESMCIDSDSAEVKAVYLSDFQDPAGWGPVVSKFGREGWQPVQFMADGADLVRWVCFKRLLS